MKQLTAAINSIFVKMMGVFFPLFSVSFNSSLLEPLPGLDKAIGLGEHNSCQVNMSITNVTAARAVTAYIAVTALIQLVCSKFDVD